MKREVVYGSDPMPDDYILKNLAVYYDKIYLPHPYGVDESARVLWSNWEMKFQDDLDYGYAHYKKWKERNSYLFNEGVIEILPDVFDNELDIGDNIGEELIKRFGIGHLDNYVFSKKEFLSREIRLNKGFILYGKLALALHYGFSKTNLPHFIWSQDLSANSNWESLSERSGTNLNDNFSSKNIQNHLIAQLLSCDSTMLNISEPNEVIKLRNDYSDEREALVYFLNELGDSVRQHLRDGALPDEAAKRSLECEVFPKLAEFKRNKKLNEQKRFVKYASGFINIDAALWSPKFFWQLSKAALGLAGDLSDDKQNDSTNRMHGFRLLARINNTNA